ncbi:hypothetical protein B6D12_07605 [Gilliamella apicola]|uniref:hypothetical protein n=1 Tax=Gilliamella apicola TaxID=1196095 RepID=UPI000A35B548|nr:hypothetical protein B5S41_11625 [Gilliamella apicola]OTP92180.1 hypothetical protein B6D05_12750 [Gilliamella apicola]OTP93270.1 hypothetical protein B6D13_10555 [Gilliamella apicola]OTQ01837.1 hypothetical protein B6D07_08110 [Gilliamella apicola]OTQ05318.1 hypothetical protein B6D12_07605 [Gilliamella apicola]
MICRSVTWSEITRFSRALNKDVELVFNAIVGSKNHTIEIVATDNDICLANKYKITCSQSIDEMTKQFTLLIKIVIFLLELKGTTSRAKNLHHL